MILLSISIKSSCGSLHTAGGVEGEWILSHTLFPNLFSPICIGEVELPNRVVMAPMSTQLGSLDGRVTPSQIAFYRARAEGGVGMIIVEFCCIDRATGLSEHRQLSLDTPEHLEGQRRLVQVIKEAGSVPCLQLQHGGMGVPRALVEGGVALGPSDIYSRKDQEKLTARALTESEIEFLIERFGQTAEQGVRAGYQVFELHGAHGYLLTQFMSPLTNKRTDQWGGSEGNRLRLIRRVIERVKRAIGNRPLSFRLSADEFSPDGLSIDDMVKIAPQLESFGVDMLHISMGLGYTGMDKVIEPMSTPEGWRLPYARKIRQAVNIPVISVGQIRWPNIAEKAIADGDADMIALGRPLLADPAWVNKARLGAIETIRPCTSCNYCVTSHAGPNGRIGCAENPRTGHELDSLPDSGSKKGSRAVVVGGGPGGIVAALMLDQAGYSVDLYESRTTLGGGLIASSAPPFKEKLTWYRDYLLRKLDMSHVRVHLGQQAELENLITLAPEIVLLAVGARVVAMDIDGIDCGNVYNAYDLLMGDENCLPSMKSKPIVVYGGGETGCETAEYLADRGYEVALITRSSIKQLARSAETIYRGVLLERLNTNSRIKIFSDTSILKIRPESVIISGQGEESREIHCSRVLIAQGRRPDVSLAESLSKAKIPYMAIGDARQGGRIGDAVHSAYEAVNALQARTSNLEDLNC